jgi:hypothetical protein
VPLFAASSALFFIAFYVVLPFLRRAGFSWFATFNLVLALPTALLGVAAIGACRLEGTPLKWPALRERLRLGAPDSATWLWTLALSAFMYGGPWANPVALAGAALATAVEGFSGRRRAGKQIVGVGAFLGLSWVLGRAGPWLSQVRLHQQPDHIKEFFSHFGPGDFMGIALAGRWWVAAYYAAVLVL